MDNFKIHRSILRKSFTETCKALDLALANKIIKIEEVLALIKNLEDKSNRIFSIDESIQQGLFLEKATKQDLEEEFLEAETFREQMNYYRVQCDFAIQSRDQEEESSMKDMGRMKSKRKFTLPKIELRKFDGNVRNWIGFWGQFRKIDEDEEIDLDDKYQYLLQATEKGSSARELVESFPPSGSNYQKALDQMKARFARDELLIEVYVRELLNLVLKQEKTGMTLADLYIKLETQLKALESLGVTSEKYAAMLLPLVESALPEEILRIWERHRSLNKYTAGDNNTVNNCNFLSMLLDFLRSEVESEERMNLAQNTFGVEEVAAKSSSSTSRKEKQENKAEQSNKDKTYTAAALYTSNFQTKKPVSCLFCNSNSHLSQNCLKAQNLSLEDRKSKVMAKKACFSCLKVNHTSKFCKTFVRCIVCSRKHFPIMCPNLVEKKDTHHASVSLESRNVENTLTSNIQSSTLLQTVLVRLINNGKEKVIRTLLDSGSQRSYILSKSAKELGLIKNREEVIIQNVFGGNQTLPKIHGVYDLHIQNLDRSFKVNLAVLDQEKICNHIPRINNQNYLDYLKRKNILINDTDMNNCSPEIELLLGADIFGKLLTGKIESLEDALVAVETYLGWTIMGQNCNCTNTIFSGVSSFSIPDLWNLELLGISDPSEVKGKHCMEEDTLKLFNEQIVINQEGRYEIHLPWIDDNVMVLSNEELAVSRLQSTSKKLIAINRFKDYERVLEEWETLGIIEIVPSITCEDIHYLAHHAVLKESSQTTKIRPVFDASAKDLRGNSLNECLQKGPNLLELIPSLILKFRIGLIGVTADIEKAFLQISVTPKDRDHLRFFWWENYPLGKKKIYRHCRVVFGLKSSPFLLGATINYHLMNSPSHLKQTARKLQESFYVDNCVTSVNTSEELEKFIRESKELMSLGKFNLREWRHSLDSIDNNYSDEYCSVLGILWNAKKDVFMCDTSMISQITDTPRTKRGLLSAAQRIFDPIGFTHPITLVPKLLLQETWSLGIGWDKELPGDIIKKFENWMKEINFLKLCMIPRRLLINSISTLNTPTIHVFCDSSKLAFASCIFLRTKFNDNIILQLIQAKSRLSPKNITIPRLELLSCLIGIRLCQNIRKVREFSNLSVFYWSDSMVSLTWIKTRGNWKTFVQNRVNEINEYSNTEQWRHVPGSMNPADILTRGCTVKSLMENTWWNGPEWLKQNSENWPHKEIIIHPEKEKEVTQEKRKEIATYVSLEKERITKNFEHFSKYSMIIRMLAWIYRFYYNSSKKKVKSGELTYDEVEEAEFNIIKMIQKESFEKRDLKNLQIFEDEKGILRLKSRLRFADTSEDFKYPILLPNKHIIVKRLILEQHNINNHIGIQTLLCILREKYWIIKGRRTVKEVISRCIKCKRFKAKYAEVPFAPLPRERVSSIAAFENSGVDLAGPLYLKGGQKVWIVLFTCAVYRAIHLELIKSLSTDSFILALRRFIARRGRITVIYSDNGTNFVGAQNLLKQIDWEKISEYSSVQKIRWIFNPVSSAWWGGWWERMVRMVKELLKRNLGKQSLEYEELVTLLCDVEAMINNRPLTYVSENIEDLLPLRPVMFLQGLPTNETIDLDTIDRRHLVSRCRYLQKLRDGLRSRFKKEYLAELVQFGQRNATLLKVGDIVLVGSDNTKRIDWPLGKIVEVIPGKDGKFRVAKIKTAHSEIIRPFQRLYPMELNALEDREWLASDERQKENNFTTQEDILQEDVHQVDAPQEDADQVDVPQVADKPVTITRKGRIVRAPQRFGF